MLVAWGERAPAELLCRQLRQGWVAARWVVHPVLWRTARVSPFPEHFSFYSYTAYGSSLHTMMVGLAAA